MSMLRRSFLQFFACAAATPVVAALTPTAPAPIEEIDPVIFPNYGYSAFNDPGHSHSMTTSQLPAHNHCHDLRGTFSHPDYRPRFPGY